ncbi:DUF1750-domain-containing protein [Westerdykella ornata]|uniref:DUF1750-domain-containing protein n=1 Tax=Westerdykella ornata TaxID=318751 RepID=A0A6A6J7C0_WESOR|nr:DUF1750-domain-containing protein [Westerdykella ornata]KAF2272134.1 DUF1750-domain-containing protein [Westerdykella ornata]
MYSMNQNFSGPVDPSALVPDQILRHVHLISSFQFPKVAALLPAQALEHLLRAPTIVKSAQPVAWTYLSTPPPDGSMFLAWQSPRMGTNFASDGLVWADAEMSFEVSVRGYTVQCFAHKAGFLPPAEPITAHARYRYRILHGPGDIDPQLYIVHYAQAEPSYRLPTSQFPLSPAVHQQLQQRAQLEAAGQLMRKDFMLADRANWPKVEFVRPPAQQPPYYNPMQPGRMYNQPPPNKRQRQTLAQQRQAGPTAMMPEHILEEEENSTQDAFDFITPREISQSRYKQHHEWMEEIFSSPYAAGQILPIDLGLGLMGELAPLTADILDAPTGAIPTRDRQDAKGKYEVKSYSKLTPEQLKEFEDRVSAYTAKAEAELEKMKAAHAKKMAGLKRSRTYVKAERRIRDAAKLASESTDSETPDLINNIVKDVEAAVGVEFETKKQVVCVDKGGFIEKQQSLAQRNQQLNGSGSTPSQADAGSTMMETMDADNSAASLLDQYGSTSLANTPGATSLSVPPISQPQSQLQSAVATPNASVPEPKQGAEGADHGTADMPGGSADDLLNLDVEMSGITNADEKAGENDWVMVDQNATAQQSTTNSDANPATGTHPAPTGPLATSTATAEAATTAAGGGGAAETGEASATAMFDSTDFGSFDNLVEDSAGDALAQYTNVDDDTMGLDLVDDSAFGDAFHGTETQHHEEQQSAEHADQGNTA